VNALQEITRFQTDRELDQKPFDWNVEATNIIEELLEAVGVNDRNVALLSVGDIQLRIREKVQAGLVMAPSVEDQVDAFAEEVFSGNPAAVCPLESWLPDDVLQSIASENNLSETDEV
jgi:hypothetical protein